MQLSGLEHGGTVPLCKKADRVCQGKYQEDDSLDSSG